MELNATKYNQNRTASCHAGQHCTVRIEHGKSGDGANVDQDVAIQNIAYNVI